MQDYPSILLAIEAATNSISLALFSDSLLVAEEAIDEPGQRHSATLLPGVDRLLRQEGLAVDDLEAIAVTRGPGSFTSVRIGLATACGLAYPRKLPIHALSTLELLAAKAHGSDKGESSWLLPMLDARKGEVYSALYGPGRNLGETRLPPSVGKAEDCVAKAVLQAGSAANLRIFGSGASVYWSGLSEKEKLDCPPPLAGFKRPEARFLGERVLWRLKNNLPCEAPTPSYLRRPEAVRRLEKDQPG